MQKRLTFGLVAVIAACALSSCNSQQTDLLPYQNPKLSPAERAADLCDRLSIEEKATIMQDRSKAIKRLGIPEFAWWSEALHGVGRNGVATMFPQCIGMASAFDTTLIYDIYSAVSDEARAKNTEQRKSGRVGKYQGLSFWTPNINIFRDPRWGRGQETYGEDPFVNAVMGKAVVRGLQGPEGHKYRKLLACAKHFAVHSGPEKTRHSLDIRDLSQRDLWETYLPAFEALVKESNVREVMCAYQRFEGEPCCGSNKLLNQILRQKWGFDGIVVSDCGAVTDFWKKGRHETAADAAEASADAVLAGTDVECGSNYMDLPTAVRRGDISEEQINISVRRLLEARFELGDFDPDELVEWTEIPTSVVASKQHIDLSLKMAREQMVLLQNKGNILPLPKDASKLMVMGPNAADSLVLWGIYYGQPIHTVTMLEGIQKKVGNVRYAKGCEIAALTVNDSHFADFTTSDGSKGFEVSYWNNEEMEGDPVVKTVYSTAINLDNGGNTAFAPGVELEHFTLRAKGCLTAQADEELILDFANDDGLRLIVNGDTIHNRWKTDFLRTGQKKLTVKKGQKYEIEMNYLQKEGGATLAFDIIKVRDIKTDDIVKMAADAETIIFIGGISPTLEREEAKVNAPGFDNGDRTSIELPKAQRDALAALHAAGKKIVFVNCSGSAVALSNETSTCDAIVQAWYAGEQGGTALADILFGDYNPGGKLPVTFYASDADIASDFEDYSMKAGKGRTYRYFTGKALFPFGFGLSYTTFALASPEWDTKTRSVKVSVSNTGSKDGADIIQVYIRNPEDADGPIKTLRGFARVELKAGETKAVSIPMPEDRFKVWDEASQTMKVKKGTYEILVGDSSTDCQTITIDL